MGNRKGVIMSYYATTADGREWEGPFSTLQKAKDRASKIAKNQADGSCLVTCEGEEIGEVVFDGAGFDYESF